jgi:hypothetical protein
LSGMRHKKAKPGDAFNKLMRFMPKEKLPLFKRAIDDAYQAGWTTGYNDVVNACVKLKTPHVPWSKLLG